MVFANQVQGTDSKMSEEIFWAGNGGASSQSKILSNKNGCIAFTGYNGYGDLFPMAFSLVDSAEPLYDAFMLDATGCIDSAIDSVWR